MSTHVQRGQAHTHGRHGRPSGPVRCCSSLSEPHFVRSTTCNAGTNSLPRRRPGPAGAALPTVLVLAGQPVAGRTDRFAAALAGFPCLEPPEWLPQAHQYFTHFEIDGIDVGASTVEVPTNAKAIECIGSGPWQHCVSITTAQHTVPAVALELRLVSELIRNRPDRYTPLIEHMRSNGADIELVRQSMREREVDPARQRQILNRLQNEPTPDSNELISDTPPIDPFRAPPGRLKPGRLSPGAGGRRTSRPVRRILCAAALRPPAAAIHLGLALPTGSCGLPAGSGEQPSNACAGHRLAAVALLGLAPGGVYLATPVARGAGELLPHRFTLTGSRWRPAVSSLWHCPAGHPGLPLATTLLCGVRTFLGGARRHRRDRPVDSSVARSS
jgi:hypothetical protein